jgi:8-oxo-dGTP pyrophosphatase MutT (NUDIX family)
LTPDKLRLALASRDLLSAGGDFDLNPDRRKAMTGPWKEAAVLIPILRRPSSLSVLFTRRTETMTSHAGQISFPGGKVDVGDRDPASTALREAYEEVGIPSTYVEVIGDLPTYKTGSGYKIQPVVGLVTPDFNFLPQPSEVAEIFEVPLSEILDPDNHMIETQTWNDAPVSYYVISVSGRRIWGATAAIVVSLSRKLGLRP